VSWNVVDGSVELQVAISCEPPEEPPFSHAENRAYRLLHLHLLLYHIETIHRSRSLVWGQQSAQNLYQSGFACAVAPQQTKQFASSNFQVHMVNRGYGSVLPLSE
jgi:hypothetical protein